jgi:hypothetical protein
MPTVDELDVLPAKGTTLLTIAIDPDEVEMALATNGASLRHATLMALIAALATASECDGLAA